MKNYKVVILTAGQGIRLRPETDNFNKALITIGNKTALSRIIENFPEDVEIVLANNYKEEQIKDFVEIAYPDREFTYVHVDNTGEGYGPGYALLACKEHLQCPFYFVTCDTLFDKEEVLSLDVNWVGMCQYVGNPMFYSKVVLQDGLGDFSCDIPTLYNTTSRVSLVKDFSWDADYSESGFAFIGLAGIADYAKYFKNLEETELISNEKQILSGFKSLTTYGQFFDSWQDVGSRESLNTTRVDSNDNNPFVKINEFTVEANNKIIKFNSDKKWVYDRLARSKILNKVVPECDSKGNFLFYNKVEGRLLSEHLFEKQNTVLFIRFLNWCKDNLWKECIIEDSEANKVAKEFYYDKTVSRLRHLFSNSTIKDYDEEMINGKWVYSTESLLHSVKDELCYMKPTIFHGDLHVGNVIKTGNDFKLIDWRQSFGNRIDIGDIYYDLAKMLHAFILPHESLRNFEFVIEKTQENHTWYYYGENKFAKTYIDHIENFCAQNNLDFSRVQLLCSIVYLNMSPLHPSPYRDLLYYLGKKKLYEYVKTKN